jgi:hypothetical protein
MSNEITIKLHFEKLPSEAYFELRRAERRKLKKTT